MKITKRQLRRIIREEFLHEQEEKENEETKKVGGFIQSIRDKWEKIKGAPLQKMEEEETQKWLGFLFGYPGFEEAAERAHDIIFEEDMGVWGTPRGVEMRDEYRGSITELDKLLQNALNDAGDKEEQAQFVEFVNKATGTKHGKPGNYSPDKGFWLSAVQLWKGEGGKAYDVGTHDTKSKRAPSKKDVPANESRRLSRRRLRRIIREIV
tara:strand:+ start:132 stop:758 length:627 start_codon:yes stop_codon:yes gene_type:complete